MLLRLARLISPKPVSGQCRATIAHPRGTHSPIARCSLSCVTVRPASARGPSPTVTKQHLFVLAVDPLATAFNEGLSCIANDVGHLQRRPVHALCVGSPSPRMGRASSGLPVALRCRRERCR